MKKIIKKEKEKQFLKALIGFIKDCNEKKK